jgi:hypothetical protein
MPAAPARQRWGDRRSHFDEIDIPTPRGPKLAECQTSDGAVRYVRAGGMVLVEDTHGKGHITRHTGQEQTMLGFALPGGPDVSAG